MEGGDGNDEYFVDAAGDTLVEQGSDTGDHVRSTVSYVLPDGVELLTLEGSAAINGTGNALANTLTGNAAANVLDGGAGIDRMEGKDGNDTYCVDSVDDMVIEGAEQGTQDRILTSINYTLAANQDIEVLRVSYPAPVSAG